MDPGHSTEPLIRVTADDVAAAVERLQAAGAAAATVTCDPAAWRSLRHAGVLRPEHAVLVLGADPGSSTRLLREGADEWLEATAPPERERAAVAAARLRRDRRLAARTEARRVAREERQHLADHIQDAVFIDDADGRVVFANEAFLRLFGIDRGALATVQLEDYVAPEWRERLRERHERRLRGEAVPNRFEYQGVRADGARLDLEVVVAPVHRDGRVIGTQSAIRDVTERRRLQAREREAERLESLGRLVGGIAHEFNNRIAVVLGHASLALRHLAPADPLRAELEAIIEAADGTADLTRRLLAFGQGQLLQLRVIDLQALVVRRRRVLESLLPGHVRLEVRGNPGVAWALGDANQLEDVLVNLVLNARDAMPEGGSIVIETARMELQPGAPVSPRLATPSRVAVLRVRDTGSGIPPEALPHVFEPYYTSKPLVHGAGLGLPMAHGIVAQCGGGIRVESTVGEGTTVELLFPLRSAPTAAHRVDRAGTLVSMTETVLVVDDDPAIVRLSARILREAGLHVLEAGSAEQALRTVQAHRGPIHLLVTDVVMPEADGGTLAARLRRERPGIAVIYVTARTPDPSLAAEARQADTLLLHKPLTPAKLVSAVYELLDGSRTSLER